jgi:hypothetical protein
MSGGLGGELLEQMELAAMLPVDDPERGRVAAKVEAVGPAAQGRWRVLTAEAEQLRLGLAQVAVPDGLELKLLGAATQTRSFWARYRAVWIGLAATILLVIGSLWSIAQIRAVHERKMEESIHMLAAMAVSQHTNRLEMIETSEPGQIESAVQPLTNFEVVVRQPPRSVRLLGGGLCSVGAQPGVFTRYANGGRVYTLLQAPMWPLGVPKDFKPRVEVPRQSCPVTGSYKVAMWVEPSLNCVWMLVSPDDGSQNPFASYH